MQADGLRDDLAGRADLPAPLSAHRVLVVAPAERALVGARQRRRGFHALVPVIVVVVVVVVVAAAVVVVVVVGVVVVGVSLIFLVG